MEKQIKIISIVGARPNFMKVAPLHRAFSKHKCIISKIVHTGQHFDEKMSDIFFKQLELPVPDYYLGVSSGTHTQQTAEIMLKFEPLLQAEKPDLVLVVGDVTSTLACALAAVKQQIPVAHVEAGLRSNDRSMPEEINRILTDNIADYLFVTEHSGLVNLAKENTLDDKVFFVGNCMIDSLVNLSPKSNQIKLAEISNQLQEDSQYILATMHRPSNVDTKEGLEKILSILEKITKRQRVVFPIHPRTLNNIEKYNLGQHLENNKNLILLPPLGYLEFIKLMSKATLILTDSGGIQEESTFLQIPCITFRANTERPITVTLGTNYLMSELDTNMVVQKVNEILDGKTKKGTIPPLWDGNAAERITKIILQLFEIN